jgi:hypothetical protein
MLEQRTRRKGERALANKEMVRLLKTSVVTSQDMKTTWIRFYRKMTCSITTCKYVVWVHMIDIVRGLAWPVECDDRDVWTMWLAAHAPLVTQE